MQRAAQRLDGRPGGAAVIERHFITVGQRQVHYRRAGTGPPVILLHQTPQSSQTMEPLMRRLMRRRTAIALDTPGFGLSDPLPGGRVSVRGLADALAETLDALGIGSAAFAGQHTGATIIMQLAMQDPGRVRAAVLDGYTMFNERERREYLPHFTYRFEPSWDGSHLVWAWSRFRDGWIFYPWSVRRRAARRAIDMPPPRRIHDHQLMELMRSGEASRRIYPAIFGFDGAEPIRRARMPVTILSAADDQLYPHLDRLPKLPSNVSAERLPGGDRDLVFDRAAELLLAVPAAAAARRPPPVTRLVGRPTRDYVRVPGGYLMAACHGGTTGRPIVLLHGAGESGAILSGLAHSLAAERPVIVLDLPGHGDSASARKGFAPRRLAREVVAALDWLGAATVDLFGRGWGAAIAVEVALAMPRRVHRLAIAEQALLGARERREFAARYAPPIVPRWDGTHLVSLWQQLRGRELFWPWFRETHAAALGREPELEPAALQARVFDALRCGEAYAEAHRAWFSWPARARLARLARPLLVIARNGDGWSRDASAIAAAARSGAVVAADGVGDTAKALIEFFSR